MRAMDITPVAKVFRQNIRSFFGYLKETNDNKNYFDTIKILCSLIIYVHHLFDLMLLYYQQTFERTQKYSLCRILCSALLYFNYLIIISKDDILYDKQNTHSLY
jgi:hypothetical protein